MVSTNTERALDPPRVGCRFAIAVADHTSDCGLSYLLATAEDDLCLRLHVLENRVDLAWVGKEVG